MKKYCYIRDKIVATIVPEFEDIFPGIPIQERYSQEFLNSCVVVDEEVEVETGMLYEDGIFKEAPPPEYVPPTEEEPEPLTPDEADILKAQNKALADRQEFIEDLIAELALMVYD